MGVCVSTKFQYGICTSGANERFANRMLLDEADVFLASRASKHDLKRNSIITVFLRVLEYYPGILIMTSNRGGLIDVSISRLPPSYHWWILTCP